MVISRARKSCRDQAGEIRVAPFAPYFTSSVPYFNAFLKREYESSDHPEPVLITCLDEIGTEPRQKIIDFGGPEGEMLSYRNV